MPWVFSMLQEGANATCIAAYLNSISPEIMDLHQKDENSKLVAELLVEWKAEIYQHR
jgi:hypothetical protein